MDDEELILVCTSCRVTYLIAVLDREGVGDPPVAAHCPFCGLKFPVTDAILAPIERELHLIKGGKK